MRGTVVAILYIYLPVYAFAETVVEFDLHDGFATGLACQLIEDDGGDGILDVNLSAQQLAEAVKAYEPDQVFTEDEIKFFRWRAAMTANCTVYEDQWSRFGTYVISEMLESTNLVVGLSLTWNHVAERATGKACARMEALGAAADEHEIWPILEELNRHWNSHPVFGEGHDSAELAELKIRWRAYWLGRYRERELSDQAVENYATAFEAFPESSNRYEINFDEISLPLFYASEQFSPERLAAFGPVTPDGQKGLDLPSYIARQQAWNYLFSGARDFPLEAPDNERALELKDDLILHLLGKAPGPEACHPVEYWEVRRDYNSILRQVLEFVGTHLNNRLDELVEVASQPETQRIESGQPIATIVKPALALWSGPDCARPIVRTTNRYIPTDRSTRNDEHQVGHAFLDGNSLGLEETLHGATVEYGFHYGLSNPGSELNAEQAERIRQNDVVSELSRTVLDRLDLFEVSWCVAGVRVPLLPGGYGVAVPSVAVREVNQLWSR